MQANKEVNQLGPNHEGHQHDPHAMHAADVEKLVNNRLQDLKIGGDFKDALRREVDQTNFLPFIAEIEQAAPQSDSERLLSHTSK